MPKYHVKNYLALQYNKEDKLYNMLDCLEQIVYKLLSIYNIDCKYLLLKNIYPILKSDKVQWTLLIPESEHMLGLYSIQKIKLTGNDPLRSIEELLDKEKNIVISTAFGNLKKYNSKEINIPGRKHYALVVGYDDRSFFLADNPNVLKNFLSTDSFVEVCRYDLLDAIEMQLEIYRVNIDNRVLQNLKYDAILKKTFEQIVSDNQTKKQNEKTKDGVCTTFYGLDALSEFQSKTMNIEYDITDNTFFINHFNAHLLSSCRTLLKICVQDSTVCQTSASMNDFMQTIDVCIEKWEFIKMLIAKNNLNPSRNFRVRIGIAISNMYESEDALSRCIQKLLKDVIKKL